MQASRASRGRIDEAVLLLAATAGAAAGNDAAPGSAWTETASLLSRVVTHLAAVPAVAVPPAVCTYP